MATAYERAAETRSRPRPDEGRIAWLRRMWAEHVAYSDWSAEEEAAFRRLERRYTARFVLFFLLTGLLALVVTWPTDTWLYDPHTVGAALREWRSAFLVTGSSLALMLMLSPRFREGRWMTPVVLTVIIIDSFVAGRSAGLLARVHMPFLYVIYAFAGVSLLFHVRVWRRALVTVTITAGFVAGYFVPFPENRHTPYLAGFAIILAVSNFVYVAVGQVIYDLTRTNYRQRRAIEEEHARNERLLLNILPAEIAERLRDDERAIADAFTDVTVLFADIVGFTPLSDRLPPAELVSFLNRLFSTFDGLVDRHGLEKIKTIGDAYMVVGGLPSPRDDHAEAVASFALDAIDAARAITGPGGRPVRLRIGMHSGPAVAGVIGVRKFSYDLWGDTVNTASRMESHGVPDRICVSEATYRLLETGFELSPRGQIEVKGKGELSAWILEGRREGARTPA